MRGIVMEQKNNKIIVMTNDGQFLEIKSFNKPVEIGQEVHFNNNVNYNKSSIRKAISIAAAFLVMITGGYGVYGYYMPFGYVDVDINPSVELSYNLYDRVIDIKGLNEDGTHIITKINDYKNKPVKDIITKVIDSAIEKKYIKADEQNAILVTITEAGSKIDDEEIFKSVDNHMKEEKLETKVVLIKSDKQEYEAAKKNNLSPGKQMLINKALSSSDKVNQQDMQNKSVKEIMSIINEEKKEDKKEDKYNKFGIKYQNKIEKASQKNNDKSEKDNDIKKNLNSNGNKDSYNNGNNRSNDNNNGKNNDNGKNSVPPQENSKEDDEIEEDDDTRNQNKGNGKVLKGDNPKNNNSDKNSNYKDKQNNENSNKNINNNNGRWK